MAGNRPQWPHCVWCEKHHAETYCCPPVRAMLAALKARGDSLTMPTLEFPDEPMEVPGFGEPGDQLLAQLVVEAATARDDLGMVRAGLMFTGRDRAGKPLPRWLYVDTDQHVADVAKLVEDMAGLAIRTATRQR